MRKDAPERLNFGFRILGVVLLLAMVPLLCGASARSRNFVAWKNYPQQVEYEPWSANTGGTTNPVSGLIKTGDMVNNYDYPKNAKGVLMP